MAESFKETFSYFSDGKIIKKNSFMIILIKTLIIKITLKILKIILATIIISITSF